VIDTTAGKRLPSSQIKVSSIDVLDPAGSLESQRFEARLDGSVEFEAQCAGAGPDFLRIVDVARAELVHDFGGLVAQHLLGAGIEQLDDALLVGGDDRERGAGEDRVLQCLRLRQAPAAPRLRGAGCVGRFSQNRAIASYLGHGGSR
jgi:hypothetical protein